MRTLKTVTFCVCVALSVLFFLQALAIADPSTPIATVAGVPLQLPSGAAGLVMMSLVFASWALRKFSTLPFFHTTAGAALMGVLTAVFPSLLHGIQAKGLTVPVVETAVFGALLSFFASDNPSMTKDQLNQRVLAMAVKRVPTPPPPIRPGILPFLFIAAFAVSGCKTAGGQALAKCELGSLPSTVGTIIAQVVAIAFSGGNYATQLEQAGVQAAESNAGGQFDCVVQAVTAWLGSSVPKGQVAQSRLEALSAFKAYVTAHPAHACGPMPPVRRAFAAGDSSRG